MEKDRKMKKQLFFFIGTEAEFIKVFPILVKAKEKGILCHIIASGQNDLTGSRIMEFIQLNGRFVELSKESSIKKSKTGLFRWFIKTKNIAKKQILKSFSKEELKGQDLIVHGDTISTFMGAWLGKQLSMRVCHVEAGLRSHNLLNPFPEEIDRLLTSRLARVHFAPGKEPSQNLMKSRVSGIVVNTGFNTILDSLRISKMMPIATEGLQDIIKDDYFVFVMHRQENMIQTDFFDSVLNRVIELSKERKCVLILHKITENKLAEMNRLKELEANKNFILLPRVDYFDFMKLLDGAKFVITDGGSNQEELHYMGKPCLIMRKTTERKEGIGQNAKLYGGNVDAVTDFAREYENMKILPVEEKYSPSKVILRFLIKND